MFSTSTDSPRASLVVWSSESRTRFTSCGMVISLTGTWCRRLVLGLSESRHDSRTPLASSSSTTQPALLLLERFSFTSGESSVPMYGRSSSGYRLQHSTFRTGLPPADSTRRMQAGVSKSIPSKEILMSRTADSWPFSRRCMPVSPNDSGVTPMRASCCQSTSSTPQRVVCCGVSPVMLCSCAGCRMSMA